MSDEVIYSRTSLKESDLKEVNRCFKADNSETSTLMSEILSSDNVNADELNLCRQWVFIGESIVRNIHKINTAMTGSTIDCSSSPGSDQDQMIQVNDTGVTEVESSEASQAGNVLVMSTNNTTPGYTLLKVYRVSQNLDRLETKSFLHSCVQNEDGLFLSSERYIKYVMDAIAGMDKYSPPSFHTGESMRHGPCVMLNYSIQGQDSDIGIGLKCSSWPKEAMEWIKRRRESNWPDAALIDKIKTMPCHVLPVGYPDSDKCSLEWRFAFVLPERELIWNLNDVQIQCFVIFKTLKKEILEKVAPDEINSFHLKTILFWLSETPIEWNKSTLFDNVRRCLSFLDECIKERHLSHYFLRSRNLFAGKLEDQKVRSCISSEISRIQENILECFMDCEWSYKYDNHLLLSVRELRKLDFLVAGRNVLQASQTVDKNYQRNKYTHARSISMQATMAVMFLQSDGNSLGQIMEEVGNQLQDTLMGIYALKFLSIRVGMLCLVEAKTTVDKDTRQNLISETKWFLETGLEHDVLAAPMYFLTYRYLTRSYDAMRTFFNDLFSRRMAIPYKGTPGLVTCGRRAFLSPDMDEIVSPEDMANENDIAFDIVFSYTDISCVPPALQYECALLDGGCNWFFCSINPLVYACYVKFQIAFNQGDLEQLQSAVEHLRKMVLYVENGEESLIGAPVELHRHYNILGYCYYVMKDVRNAMEWFKKSLKACPTIGNAAAYHLCVTLFIYGYPSSKI